MLRPFVSSLLLACTLAACSGASGGDVESAGAASASEPGPAITGEFLTPSAAGEQPVIDQINTAKTSIRMIMFHLTNPAVVTALVAAQNRGVDVQIIIDHENLSDHTPTSITSPLKAAGVKVIPSSTGFRITHVKSLVIDSERALIMSLNLTMDYATTRDYAVVTTDSGVIKEFLKVFAADVVNAQNGTGATPTLSSPYLAWSPVNSEGRLTAFVNAAKHTLVATSENIGDPDIQAAMISAVKRGVAVRIITPLCDQNVNPLYDLPYLSALAAGGVEARAMPSPASAETPYMHAKMMIADGANAFVGSVNFSSASTTDARELGIFFTDDPAIQMISAEFEQDWSRAITPPPAASVVCSGVATTDAGPPAVDAAPPPPPPSDDAGVDAATDDASGGHVDASPPPPPPPPPPSQDAGTDAANSNDSGPSCPGYTSPSTADNCTGCTSETCQANGCYGGYWCDDANGKCVSESKACGS